MPYDLLDALNTYLDRAYNECPEMDLIDGTEWQVDPCAKLNALLANAEHTDYLSIRGEVMA